MLQPLRLQDRTPAEDIYLRWYVGMFPMRDKTGALRFVQSPPEWKIGTPVDPSNPFIVTNQSINGSFWDSDAFAAQRQADLRFIAYMDWLNAWQNQGAVQNGFPLEAFGGYHE